ncbi:MAG: helix-turn-helix domain-containing protein [Raoultibacter sp.]
MEDVGRVIRTRRKEFGYTQTDIANFAGCSQRLISEVERGRPTVAFETVLRIANGLGIDLVLSIRGKQ